MANFNVKWNNVALDEGNSIVDTSNSKKVKIC